MQGHELFRSSGWNISVAEVHVQAVFSWQFIE